MARTPTIDSETPYLATADTANADLETLTWRIDNRTLLKDSLDGTADRSTRLLTFIEAETRRLEVAVRDTENRTVSAVLLIDPQEQTEAPTRPITTGAPTTLRTSSPHRGPTTPSDNPMRKSPPTASTASSSTAMPGVSATLATPATPTKRRGVRRTSVASGGRPVKLTEVVSLQMKNQITDQGTDSAVSTKLRILR